MEVSVALGPWAYVETLLDCVSCAVISNVHYFYATVKYFFPQLSEFPSNSILY